MERRRTLRRVSEPKRRSPAVGILPALALLLLLGAVGAFIAEHRSESVIEARAADKAAGEYASSVATFRAQAIAQLAQYRGAQPAQLREVVDAQLAAFPAPPSPEPAGAQNSQSYQSALAGAEQTKSTFTDLRTQLDTAATAQVFIAGATRALQQSKVALLRTALVLDTGPLKSRTLPALRNAQADVRRLSVPEKGRAAAQAVDSTIARAIREVQTMVDELDDGDSYSYDLTDAFNAADTQLRNYGVDVDGDVSEALGRLQDG